MKSRPIAAVALAALCLGALSGVAHARNPNCAGGIQYLSQAMKDKAKPGGVGMVDYEREIVKAVQRLEMCAVEDPKDFEAIGYLAWAYAEVDSACAAGAAFKTSVEGLKAKGDKKKVEMVENNRESYWATKFNDGIAKINSAQTAYIDFQKEPADEGEKALKAEAEKNYREALTSLTQAACLKPGDPRTLRNLGTVHALMGDYGTAEKLINEALAAAPGDSDLVAAKRSVQIGAANRLVVGEKWDEAIVAFGGLTKEYPSDADFWAGLASAHFQRAQKKEGAERKADFHAAGVAYAKAATIKTNDGDLPFNSALAFQSAGEYEAAEVQWRATIKLRPDDADAESALGATLAELKKFDEAVAHVLRAVSLDPKNKARHRQLGAVYTKANNNAKATEELMVYLALDKGKPVADVAAETAKASAGSDAAKTKGEAGAPEDIYLWEADGEKYESWFYWSKGNAQHFKAGSKVQRSDWSATNVKAAK